MEKMGKKGFTLQQLAPIAISFVVIAIVLGIGATVVEDVQDTQTENATAFNASGSGLEAIDTLANWLPTIGVIVAAAVVIGIIVAYFRFWGFSEDDKK